jgi:cell division protein FtsB
MPKRLFFVHIHSTEVSLPDMQSRSRAFTLSRPWFELESSDSLGTQVEETPQKPPASIELVQRAEFPKRLPASPISTVKDSMSFSFVDSVEEKEEDEEISPIINDEQFQIEALQEEIETLKAENSKLVGNLDLLTSEKELLLVKNVDLKKKNAVLKLRVGELGRKVAKFRGGIFPSDIPVYGIGSGSFFDGQNVYWRKASQALWDEDLHAPLFGNDDNNTNFVLLQRMMPHRNEQDKRVFVHAVGTKVVPGTMLRFQIHDETAYFGF